MNNYFETLTNYLDQNRISYNLNDNPSDEDIKRIESSIRIRNNIEKLFGDNADYSSVKVSSLKIVRVIRKERLKLRKMQLDHITGKLKIQ